jgi:HAD superfamily hydrolase (TIGR01484 family)
MGLLLATDLDRTLLPNGIQQESPQARRLFSRVMTRPEITLAYVSGRHLQLVERAIASYALPHPKFIVTDVGTRIYRRGDDGWRVWEEWEREIGRDWGDLDHAGLRALFADLHQLRPQETSKQSRYKLSYYLPLQANRAALEGEMQRRLRTHGVRASLIWSLDEPAGVGLLDVLPLGATKLHAVEFLREQLGLAVSETLFAGDSGNDLPVLASRLPSVLVANAAPEVRDVARSAAAAAGHADALYLAKGGLLGMNGNYAAGILEGLVHFFPEAMAWVEAASD